MLVPRLNFHGGYLLSSHVPSGLRFYLWRYKHGLKYSDMQERHEKKTGKRLSSRSLRDRVHRIGCLMDLWSGKPHSPVHVPDITLAVNTAAEAVRDRQLALREGQMTPKEASREESTAAPEEASVYALNNPTDLARDRRRRERLTGKRLPKHNYPERTLVQDLMLMVLGSHTQRIRDHYHLSPNQVTRWGKSLDPRAFKEGREMPWARLVLLVREGAHALGKGDWRGLFDKEQVIKLVKQEAHQRGFGAVRPDPAMTRAHALRVWRYFGGTRGWAMSLPMAYRSKENVRLWYRSVRRWLSTLSIDVQGQVTPVSSLTAALDGLLGVVEGSKRRRCSACRVQLAEVDFAWRNREKGLRKSRCRSCMKLDIAAPRKKRKTLPRVKEDVGSMFRKRRAARLAGKENGVVITRTQLARGPRVQTIDTDRPTPIEEKVRQVNEEFTVPVDEAAVRERKAERRARALMKRATGGDVEKEIDEWVKNLKPWR